MNIRADDPFRPDAFFTRARGRLRHQEPGPEADRHDIVNPRFVPPPGFVFHKAAVLIPIVARDVPTVLLTRRTQHLRQHAGQIAFPGGRIDPTDSDAEAAARREAFEEIGLRPDAIDTIGYLDPYLVGTGYRIVPVVARIDPQHELMLNPSEVDAAFEVPLAFLMAPENHRQGSREWQGVRHFFYEMPYDEHYIWGVTAGIIRGLYERLFE